MPAMKFEKALFIFRRDLRLEDNTGLIFALQNAKQVIPAFIFTPQQIENNPYLSLRALQFMVESLEELDEALKEAAAGLYVFYGNPESVVEQCIKELHVDAVITNKDYTPYSLKRDKAIGSICDKNKVSFHSFDDLLLAPPQDTLKSDGTPYAIFTPFFRNAIKNSVNLPQSNRNHNYYRAKISFADEHILKKILPKRDSQAKGGRKAAIALLEKQTPNYATLRDYPSIDATTHLSAHLKFTTCSPREVYHRLIQKYGQEDELIRSLYWRDFFSSIAFYYPHVFTGPFQKKFSNLPWNNDLEAFNRWCEGKTGFPLVDAGMRELNETGYMHNRVRMITAAFLVKDLHINWRWGEKYFAQKLIDYDPAINNGNWQWAASTGCDAQPYFRIFNPWAQGQRFDSDCVYIKKWLPELRTIPHSIIHKFYLSKNQGLLPNYPMPMVDHAVEAKITLNAYRSVL